MTDHDPEQPQIDAAEYLEGEQLAVWQHRYREARGAGMNQAQASLFADSTADVGELRKLAAARVSGDMIARIVL